MSGRLGCRCNDYFDCRYSHQESCCGNTCMDRSSCLGLYCKNFTDCASTGGQSCCSNKCVEGPSCVGQTCQSDSDCSQYEICCGKKCLYYYMDGCVRETAISKSLIGGSLFIFFVIGNIVILTIAC